MKIEISKMAKYNSFKSFIGLICLILTSSASIEGMRLGNVLNSKIEEQRKTLQALQAQIDEININIETEKSRGLSIQKKKTTKEDDGIIDFQKAAIKNLKKEVPALQTKIKDQKSFLDYLNKAPKDLEREISELNVQKQELENDIFLKKYKPKCVDMSLLDVLAQCYKKLKIRVFPVYLNTKQFDDVQKKLTETIVQPYIKEVWPFVERKIENEEDREKFKRANFLLLENHKLRQLLFMAENDITEEFFESL